jgi:hypothetical protein
MAPFIVLNLKDHPAAWAYAEVVWACAEERQRRFCRRSSRVPSSMADRICMTSSCRWLDYRRMRKGYRPGRNAGYRSRTFDAHRRRNPPAQELPMPKPTTRSDRQGISLYTLSAQEGDGAPPLIPFVVSACCSVEMKGNHDINARRRGDHGCRLIDNYWRRWRDISGRWCGRDQNGRRRLSDDDAGGIIIVATVMLVAISMCWRPRWRIGKGR